MQEVGLGTSDERTGQVAVIKTFGAGSASSTSRSSSGVSDVPNCSSSPDCAREDEEAARDPSETVAVALDVRGESIPPTDRFWP